MSSAFPSKTICAQSRLDLMKKETEKKTDVRVYVFDWRFVDEYLRNMGK